MYAITHSGFRSITDGMELLPGETAAETVPESTLLRIKADQARSERSRRLRDTDWTQMPDAPLTSAQRAAMAAYRQALRDLPELPGFPDCGWPPSPAEG